MKIRHITASLVALLCFGALLPACGESYEEPLPPRERLHFPIGLALHPTGRYLYVVNSNFDVRYREDLGGTLAVVDTESLEVLGERSHYMPSFGGYVRLNAQATKAYVTSRHANEIHAFDLSPDGGRVGCLVPGISVASGSRTQAPSTDLGPCRIQRIPDERNGARLGADPFGLDVTTVERTIASTGQRLVFDMLNVAHLRSTQVSTITLRDPSLSTASMGSASLGQATNHIARRPGTLEFYAAGRTGNFVYVYQPYLRPESHQVEAMIQRGEIELGRGPEALDIRALAFNATGERLYAVSRNPPALHIVGIAEEQGQVRRESLRTLPLARRPSDVLYHAGVAGQERLYVTSFEEGTVEVLDPQSGQVLDTIATGSEPYQMVVDQAPGRCEAPGQPCRAYVSLFSDSPREGVRCKDLPRELSCGSVAVLDLDPQSPTFHTVIARIR